MGRGSDMFPALAGERKPAVFRQAEPVQEDVDERVILPPGAQQGVQPRPLREEAAVKPDADGDAAGAQKEVARRHMPGDQQKDPVSERPRQGHQTAVEEILHGLASPGADRSATNQVSSLAGADGSTVSI